MKPNSPPEPLYTFAYSNLGYSIQIVPHSAADSAKIKREARQRRVSLRDYWPGRNHRLNGVGRVRNVKQEPAHVRY